MQTIGLSRAAHLFFSQMVVGREQSTFFLHFVPTTSSISGWIDESSFVEDSVVLERRVDLRLLVVVDSSSDFPVLLATSPCSSVGDVWIIVVEAGILPEGLNVF